VAFSSDGNYIAATSYDYKEVSSILYVFNHASDSPVMKYENNTVIGALDISSDGKTIVAISDGDLTVFENFNNAPLWSYNIGYSPYYIAISENGEFIAVGTTSSTMLFNKSDPSGPMWNYTLSNPNEFHQLSISSEGNCIARRGSNSSSEDVIYLFNRTGPTPFLTYYPDKRTGILSISADGRYILLGFYGGFKIFQLPSLTLIWKYDSPEYEGGRATMSADGKYIAIASTLSTVSRLKSKLYFFQNSSSEPLWTKSLDEWYHHIGVPISIAISSNGKFIAVSGSDRIWFFENTSPEPKWVYIFHEKQASFDAQISADGNWILAIPDVGACFGQSPCNYLYLFARENFYIPNFFILTSIVSLIIGIGIATIYFYIKKKNIVNPENISEYLEKMENLIQNSKHSEALDLCEKILKNQQEIPKTTIDQINDIKIDLAEKLKDS
jgi:hypothetical protein